MDTIFVFIFTLLFVSTLALPVVDKGVFVITGVKTCGEGSGYCILGADCTVDKEFIPDEQNGHCDGLRKAFTPRAFFVCCQVIDFNSTTTTIKPTTSKPTQQQESVESVESKSDESTQEENSDETTTTTAALSPTTLDNLLRDDLDAAVSNESDIPLTLVGTSPVAPPSAIPTTPSATFAPSAALTTPSDTPTTPTPTTNSPIEVQTTIDITLLNYTSCDSSNANNNRKTGSRLAASSQGSAGQAGVCWTGALTRTSSGLLPYGAYPDPGSFICTGALISNTLLLTTATCVSRLFGQQDLSQYKVALGSRHLLHPMNGPTGDAHYRNIKELIIHEDYRVEHSYLRLNDIALVRLSEGENDGSYCTVCLPLAANENHAGQECVVSGYSHPTNHNNHISSVIESDGILHEAEQYIEYPSNCDNVLSNYTTNSNSETGGGFHGNGLLCASGKYSAEACFSPRDAGSPLACPILTESGGGGGYRLQGVFSSGFHCGTPQMPVLYTDVSHHLKWIHQFL